MQPFPLGECYIRIVEVEGSNPFVSTNKEHTFVYQKCVLCLSKPQAWHIITRQRVYHQRRLAAFVSHHGVSRAYPFLRLDDMPFLTKRMIYKASP